MYVPLIVVLSLNSLIYGRVVFILSKQSRQRNSYNVSKPPSHQQNDKSHRERWHTLQRSLSLFVVVSITWLIGLPMLTNRSEVIQSVFTMFAVLQGLFLFGFHCLWGKAGRQAAVDLWQKLSHPVVGRHGNFELNNSHTDHPTAGNRDSVISASDLSLTSIEMHMRRASPLGASNSSLNRGQGAQTVIAQPPPLPLLPDPQPVYTEINIDEVVARRTSSSSAPPGSLPTSLKNGSILRGALKKPHSSSSPGHSRAGSRSVSRSNSRKKVKKAVSWGEAIVQEDAGDELSAESMERLSSSVERGVNSGGAWLRGNALARRLEQEEQDIETDEVFETSDDIGEWESGDEDQEWRCQKVDVAF